jgi:hypothetical protein
MTIAQAVYALSTGSETFETLRGKVSKVDWEAVRKAFEEKLSLSDLAKKARSWM